MYGNVLIEPPMKVFSSSFSSIKSLNSSSIGWNISLMVSTMPPVESCPSLESLIISSTFSIISFIVAVLASPTDLFFSSVLAYVPVLYCPCSLLDIFYPFFLGGYGKKLELVSIFRFKPVNLYALYLKKTHENHFAGIIISFMTRFHYLESLWNCQRLN